jgi:cytochrome c nitrite reductase small subunit
MVAKVKRFKLRSVALGVLVSLVAVGLFLAVGPPQLFAKSEEPDFCGATCHPMASNYESWFHGGPHRQVKCVECHLPNTSMPRHLWQKGRDGLHDFMVFSTGRVPERIALSDRGATLVQENCLHCHGSMATHIDQERRCWDCHRGMSHSFGGSVDMRAP